MAVSGNTSLDFQRDQLLRMSYQLCGLVEPGKDPTAAQIGMAADFMNLELQALQAEKVVLRTVERTTLTLVAGTASYTLPSDTIDVSFGPSGQAGTIVPTSGTESLVTNMTRAEYLDLSDKSATVTGRPTRVYIERLATITAVFWPVPDASSTSWRYARVRLLNDMDSGSVTTDLARRWLKYVAYAVAAHVARASSLSLDKVRDLAKEAEGLKEKCKADDMERGITRFRVAHSGRTW